jgi:chemotaxis regulatin CheY-phosphate phosphatase CheZ
MASSRESRLAYTNRLAELVVHLTDCAPERAIAAVEAQHPVDPVSSDDALAVVARAMCSVRRVDLRDKLDLRDVPSERTEQSRGQ